MTRLNVDRAASGFEIVERSVAKITIHSVCVLNRKLATIDLCFGKDARR